MAGKRRLYEPSTGGGCAALLILAFVIFLAWVFWSNGINPLEWLFGED